MEKRCKIEGDFNKTAENFDSFKHQELISDNNYQFQIYNKPRSTFTNIKSR